MLKRWVRAVKINQGSGNWLRTCNSSKAIPLISYWQWVIITPAGGDVDLLSDRTWREEQSPQIVDLLHMFHATHSDQETCDSAVQPGRTNPFCTWGLSPSACWESKVRRGGRDTSEGLTMSSEPLLCCSWGPRDKTTGTAAATETPEKKNTNKPAAVRSVRRDSFPSFYSLPLNNMCKSVAGECNCKNSWYLLHEVTVWNDVITAPQLSKVLLYYFGCTIITTSAVSFTCSLAFGCVA